MRGLDERLSVAERVAWYRRRRGMSQEVLAGLVGRTEDWLSKIENGRANLDRLSVINRFAEALDVTLGDLIGAPQFVDWNADTKRQTVSSLRQAVMSYADLTPDPGASPAAPADLAAVAQHVEDLWSAFQAARFGYVTHMSPRALASASALARDADPTTRREGLKALALIYQATATTLTKIGENQLSWICSDRGQRAADEAESADVSTSLVRSVAHSLLANGYYADALTIVDRKLRQLSPLRAAAAPVSMSLYGSLFLVAAMAAARAEDAPEARRMIRRAERTAARLGPDANHLWTAFGPTNVAIHQVSVAMDAGDARIAADLGPRLSVAGMPTERRIRHRLEVARALNATNASDRGLSILLDAERDAPEQVRYHFLSRHLVVSWLRSPRMKPAPELHGLARRLHVA